MRVLLLLLAAAAAGCSSEVPQDADGPVEATDAPASVAPGPAPGATPGAPSQATDGKPEVVLYVTEWCPYCSQAREYMTAEGVPHRVVDIEASAENQAEYRARGGTGGIPLVAVGAETIEGWSAGVAREMLDAAGYD